MKVGIIVRCAVCGNSKKPIGRSAPLGCSPCDESCEGYRREPYPGVLWPGESERDYGYPVGADGWRDEEPADAIAEAVAILTRLAWAMDPAHCYDDDLRARYTAFLQRHGDTAWVTQDNLSALAT